MRELMAKVSLRGVLLAKERGHAHAFLDGRSLVWKDFAQTCYCFAGVVRKVIVEVMND